MPGLTTESFVGFSTLDEYRDIVQAVNDLANKGGGLLMIPPRSYVAPPGGVTVPASVALWFLPLARLVGLVTDTIVIFGPLFSAEPLATILPGWGGRSVAGNQGIAGGTTPVGAVPVSVGPANAAGASATAAAADHVHSIAAGAVGPGPIANLTLTTALLAVNAVTQVLSAFGATSGPTTTSTAYVDLPDLFMTFTSTGAPILLLAYCDVSPSAANIGSFLGWNMDAGADNDLSANQVNASEFSTTLMGFAVTQPAAGSHTFKARWKLGAAGTLTGQGIRRGLVCIEIKR